MNCRKIGSLLSAYIDREVSPEERQTIEEHLSFCSSCRIEHETLLETKSLVANLGRRTSREELHRLLASCEPERPPRRPWVSHPLAATVFLSLAGLWLATVSLDNPRDWHLRTSFPDVMPDMGDPSPTLVVPAAPVTVSVTTYNAYWRGNIMARPILNGNSLVTVPTRDISWREALHNLMQKGLTSQERRHIPASFLPFEVSAPSYNHTTPVSFERCLVGQ